MTINGNDEKTSIQKWPKITIVTPSYNQAEFIEKTITSVLNQDYPNLEYIIIDGGSTDNSVDIIKKYEQNISFWVSEKDGGQTQAINKGFRRATGDIVAWLNSDDEYTAGALQKVAKTFMSNDEIDFVFGNRLSVDVEGNILRYDRSTRFSFSALVLLGMTISQPSCFWKRSLFEKQGYLDESKHFGMDYEFFCRIGRYIHPKHINNPLSLFRWHDEQKSGTILDIRDSDRQEIKNRYIQAVCGRYPVWAVKVTIYLYRTFCYIAQGDIIYVLRGIIRRLIKKPLRPRWL